jgi:subtilisin family serine protease
VLRVRFLGQLWVLFLWGVFSASNSFSDQQRWPMYASETSYFDHIYLPLTVSLNVDSVLAVLSTGQPIKVAGRLIVEASNPLASIDAEIESISKAKWSELINYPDHYFYLVQYPTVGDALNAMSALKNRPDIEYVQPDVLPLRLPTQRPEKWPEPIIFNEKSFNMSDYLPLDSLWQISRGQGQRIAVIDIGFDNQHPALAKMPLADSWNIDFNLKNVTAENNHELHGSYVVGIIWSRPELVDPHVKRLQPGLAWGIAPESELIALKLHHPWTSNLLKTFFRAEQQQADIINVSWLVPWVADPVRQYLKYLVTEANNQRGILVVAAADPQFRANIGLAAMPELLVVTSVDHQEQLAASSWDDTVDIAAVSYIPTVSYRKNRIFERFAKTSASVPVVSGLAALFRAVNPELTATDIQTLLLSSAHQNELTLASGETVKYKSLDAKAAYQQLISKMLLKEKSVIDLDNNYDIR